MNSFVSALRKIVETIEKLRQNEQTECRRLSKLLLNECTSLLRLLNSYPETEGTSKIIQLIIESLTRVIQDCDLAESGSSLIEV